jgi:hypothetical protein
LDGACVEFCDRRRKPEAEVNRMSRVLFVVVLFLGLVFAPVTQAGIRKGHERTVYGMLESIDSSGKFISISILNKKTNEMKNHKIKVDSSTKVLLNGQEAALSALPIGQSLTVEVSHGLAVQIQAMTH